VFGDRIGVEVEVPSRDHAAARRAELDAQQQVDQAIHARLVAAIEAERARIARDLHDIVGQALSAVRLSLLSLDSSDVRLRARAVGISDSLAAVDDAIRQVRTAAFDLRPAVLDDLGLGPALRSLCRQVARRSGITVACRAAIGDMRLPSDVETTCYRVAQEAITNTLRHSGARHLRVGIVLRRRAGTLDLEVRDDGAGFDPSLCSGARCIGLRGMAERAAIVGGTLEVRSGPGRGTTVLARFPVGRPAGSGR
jgi:signal transduction histidine kinase